MMPRKPKPLIVVALGGNALLQPGEEISIGVQRRNARKAASAIANTLDSHDVIVTHGNGPQIGTLSLQSQAAPLIEGQTIDILNAESVGMIGYILEQELINQLSGQPVVSLLTMVEVDRQDLAFRRPSKPIGPWYTPADWQVIADLYNWPSITENGKCRRVVPSPEPHAILELEAIKTLREAGNVVICAGGGGIAVQRLADGTIEGVDAIVDKDLTAGLLATTLKADILLFLTDVDAVYRNWLRSDAERIKSIDRETAKHLRLPEGSMAPKVEAGLRFVEATGKAAQIGRLEQINKIIRREAGTELAVSKTGQLGGRANKD
jgi:carbamate kinase